MSDRVKQFDDALAAGKVTAERGKVYAAPSIDFSRAARLKAVIAECSDPLARHTLEMIAVKMARLIQSPWHLDSWIDIAGYARCGVSVTEPEEISAGKIVRVCGKCRTISNCTYSRRCPETGERLEPSP